MGLRIGYNIKRIVELEEALRTARQETQDAVKQLGVLQQEFNEVKESTASYIQSSTALVSQQLKIIGQQAQDLALAEQLLDVVTLRGNYAHQEITRSREGLQQLAARAEAAEASARIWKKRAKAANRELGRTQAEIHQLKVRLDTVEEQANTDGHTLDRIKQCLVNQPSSSNP